MKKYKNIVFLIVFISISFIIIIFNQIIDPYETKNFDNIIIENLDDNKKLAYTQFKKKMVQITPFYDFSFINDFTVKPIRFFMDALYPNYDLFEGDITNFLLFNNIDKKYIDSYTMLNLPDKEYEQYSKKMYYKDADKFFNKYIEKKSKIL